MRVRVSIGNLVDRVVISETGAEHYVGLLNSAAFRKGNRMFGAIGGAAELTEYGKALLVTRMGAENFEGMDARFEVEEKHLSDILDFFS